MNNNEDLSPNERVIAYLLAKYVESIVDIESAITYEALAHTLGLEPEEVLDALEHAQALQENGKQITTEASSV
jgi:hypothetical protein